MHEMEVFVFRVAINNLLVSYFSKTISCRRRKICAICFFIRCFIKFIFNILSKISISWSWLNERNFYITSFVEFLKRLSKMTIITLRSGIHREIFMNKISCLISNIYNQRLFFPCYMKIILNCFDFQYL